MKKQYLVIGAGRFGKGIIKELTRRHANEVVVIDEFEKNLKEIEDKVDMCLVGDCKEDEVLLDLDIKKFDAIFLAIGSNEHAAIIITKKLKDLHAKKIIAKSISKEMGEILTVLGADRIVYPEEEAGIKTARLEMFGKVIEYLQIAEGISAMEINVPKAFIGKSIIDLKFSQKYNLTVAIILRKGKVVSNHFVESVLEEEDRMIIVGEETKMEIFKKKFIK